MSYWKTFCGAVGAGAAIAIGGTVYLSLDDRIAGALLFAVGLYLICAQGLNLFTGKVGYAVTQPKQYWAELAVIWCGNYFGTFMSALALRATRVSGIAEKAQQLCAGKEGDSLLSLLLLGVFCGILMYGAVDSYKKTTNPLILFACVSVFILCGFEHCIADMFYFSLAGRFSLDILLRLLVITAGNTLGGILIPVLQQKRAA